MNESQLNGRFSDEGICVDGRKVMQELEDKGMKVTDFQAIKKGMLDKIGIGHLPKITSATAEVKLNGRHFVQIVTIQDICRPPAKQNYVYDSSFLYKESSKRLLRLKLTDGCSPSVKAIEFHPIGALSSSILPGCKLLLEDVPIMKGFLLLDSRNTKVLGGHVEKLEEEWKIQMGSKSRGRKPVDGEDGPPRFVPFSKKERTSGQSGSNSRSSRQPIDRLSRSKDSRSVGRLTNDISQEKPNSSNQHGFESGRSEVGHNRELTSKFSKLGTQEAFDTNYKNDEIQTIEGNLPARFQKGRGRIGRNNNTRERNDRGKRDFDVGRGRGRKDERGRGGGRGRGRGRGRETEEPAFHRGDYDRGRGRDSGYENKGGSTRFSIANVIESELNAVQPEMTNIGNQPIIDEYFHDYDWENNIKEDHFLNIESNSTQSRFSEKLELGRGFESQNYRAESDSVETINYYYDPHMNPNRRPPEFDYVASQESDKKKIDPTEKFPMKSRRGRGFQTSTHKNPDSKSSYNPLNYPVNSNVSYDNPDIQRQPRNTHSLGGGDVNYLLPQAFSSSHHNQPQFHHRQTPHDQQSNTNTNQQNNHNPRAFHPRPPRRSRNI